MIGQMCVQNLELLDSVTIPEGIEKIGNHWFHNSSVRSVTVPASVVEIGAGAFCECAELQRLVFQT